ncbi:glycosyltransferase family 39 protein [Micromonospora sp. B11E3]|uniref:glycosyltransferase family 39 protein n=1 Tax=Micromonospora sp. B11E3 TaxID=3153562 RepID=UPI00325DA8D3
MNGGRAAGRAAPAPPRPVPVWVVPALLTLAVTLTGVNGAQPWRDELATWSAATRSPAGLARMAGTIDAGAVPYYLLMHGWLALTGDSATALRLPSVLAMAGAAGLTAVLGERLLGRRTGLAGGLLFAAVPGASRYAQEARPYAFVALFAVLATLLLVRAIDRPGWRAWAAYAAAVTALGLAHLVALGLLAAHAVAVLARRGRGAARRAGAADSPAAHSRPADDPARAADSRAEPAGRRGRPLRGWLTALAPAAAVLAPLALLSAGQRGRQLDWVDPARLADLAALPGALARAGAVGGLLLGLAVLGAVRAGRRALLPAAGVALPTLLLFVAGLAAPVWVPRYLFFTVPFACLLAGAALATVTLPAASAVVLLAALLGLPDQAALRRSHEWPPGALVDYRGAARVVDQGRRPGDAVVFSPRDGWLFLDLGTRYHLGDRQPRDALAVRGPDARGDYWADECARPAECLAGVPRIWLVVAGHPAAPVDAVPGAKGAALRGTFTVARVWARPGVTVALLTR